MRKRKTIFILLFWLILWQIGTILMNNPILFVGPFQVAQSLFRLLQQGSFWKSIGFSFCKIGFGFLCALFFGVLLGCAAFFYPLIEDFLAPLIALIKSIPVASFVILALIWMGSTNLSILISILVVFPIIYISTISGLKSTDKKLLEMADVFRLHGWKRARYIYLPALLPYWNNSLKTALAMGWKSGIAAEVIGVPQHSIGSQLYMAKIYLNTADLFAWTLTIIAISILSEKLMLSLLRRIPG